MIVVHHLADSRSQRVLWLLEELGLAYEVRRYERDGATMLAPPELKAVHPLGKSPVITDGGLTLAETGAIATYLCDTYGAGRLGPAPEAGPPNAARLRWLYWLHYAEGSAMPPLVLDLIFRALPTRAPALLRPLVKAVAAQVDKAYIGPQLALHADFWDLSLGRDGWFAGPEFGAADIMMSFPMEAFARHGAPERPRLSAFLATIHARPAYARALARGGPYALA